MLHVDNITGNGEHGPLASDLQRLVRVVGAWAANRPLILDVCLFGRRIRPNHSGAHPLTCAVRFDDARMVEGFDDWIEELRTNFAGLAQTLGEPVSIITPDMQSAWQAIINGTEFRALASGKVRIVTSLARQAADVETLASPIPTQPVSFWPALWQAIAGATTPHRPTI